MNRLTEVVLPDRDLRPEETAQTTTKEIPQNQQPSTCKVISFNIQPTQQTTIRKKHNAIHKQKLISCLAFDVKVGSFRKKAAVQKESGSSLYT